MRWHNLNRSDLGKARTIRRFLLWPRTINNKTRWLEWATILQEVYRVDLEWADGKISSTYDWCDEKWID